MPHPMGDEIWRPEDLTKATFGTPQQIAMLEGEKRKVEWTLHGQSEMDGSPLETIRDRMMRQGSPPMPVDPEMMRESLLRIDRSLEHMRPPTGLKQLQLAKYYRKFNELTETIKEGMPTQSDMQRGSDITVRQNLAWQQHKAPLAIARRNIGEILRANSDRTNDDPFFCSVELIRPEQGPVIDLTKWNENWELMRFTDEMERELSKPDEMTYLRFCRFKLQGYSEKSIMQELALTKAGYEACLDRLDSEMGHQAPAPPHDEEDDDEIDEDVSNGMIADTIPPLSPRFTGIELKAGIAAVGVSQRVFADKAGISLGILRAYLHGHQKTLKAEQRIALLMAYEDLAQAPQAPTATHPEPSVSTAPVPIIEAEPVTVGAAGLPY